MTEAQINRFSPKLAEHSEVGRKIVNIREDPKAFVACFPMKLMDEIQQNKLCVYLK